MSLDYRTPYEIEHGQPGPNIRLHLLFGAMVAAIPAVMPPPITLLSFAWAGVGALASFYASYRFFAWQKARGIPRIMISSTFMMGSFFIPLAIGFCILFLKMGTLAFLK